MWQQAPESGQELVKSWHNPKCGKTDAVFGARADPVVAIAAQDRVGNPPTKG